MKLLPLTTPSDRFHSALRGDPARLSSAWLCSLLSLQQAAGGARRLWHETWRALFFSLCPEGLDHPAGSTIPRTVGLQIRDLPSWSVLAVALVAVRDGLSSVNNTLSHRYHLSC